METIPDEVLLLILDALPEEDLANAARVCTKWRALSRDDGPWKRHVESFVLENTLDVYTTLPSHSIALEIHMTARNDSGRPYWELYRSLWLRFSSTMWMYVNKKTGSAVLRSTFIKWYGSTSSERARKRLTGDYCLHRVRHMVKDGPPKPSPSAACLANVRRAAERGHVRRLSGVSKRSRSRAHQVLGRQGKKCGMY